MKQLVSRHIKVFARDRTAFCLSFLSVVILIVMYKIFLGQFQIDEINKEMGTTVANESVINMVNDWLVAGVITITTMTSTLGAYGVMILDKESGKIEDLKLTAVSAGTLQSSYMIASVLMGTIISFFSFFISSLLFVGIGMFDTLTTMKLLSILGGVFASSVLSMLMMYPICKLINTRSAFSTLSTIVGTVIGFISGVYISIGSVSSTLKVVMTYFPLTQMNTLFKKVLMEQSLNEVFANAPTGASESYRQNYGVDLIMHSGTVATVQDMLLYLVLFTIGLVLINSVISRMVTRHEHG